MTFVDVQMAPHLAAVVEAASDLSTAQRNFLTLHAKRLVDRWQWHFMESQLRAHAKNRTATIWCVELDDLISRGLMVKGMGAADVHITDAGRAAL